MAGSGCYKQVTPNGVMGQPAAEGANACKVQAASLSSWRVLAGRGNCPCAGDDARKLSRGWFLGSPRVLLDRRQAGEADAARLGRQAERSPAIRLYNQASEQ
jgi:hypothetical protein